MSEMKEKIVREVTVKVEWVNTHQEYIAKTTGYGTPVTLNDLLKNLQGRIVKLTVENIGDCR